MDDLALILLISSVILMLAVAILLYQSSKNAHQFEKINNHFEQIFTQNQLTSVSTNGIRHPYWHRLRAKASIYAGFELETWHFFAIPLFLSLLGLITWDIFGGLTALLLIFTIILIFGFFLPYSRLQRKNSFIISQLPIFIDYILRSLSAGHSLERAIILACEDTPRPLKDMLDYVVRAHELGADITESFNETARLHNQKELNLFAFAMHISNSYGSNPEEMLEHVISMIRDQELARKELAAMTGETRLSAWVLGVLPLALVTYLLMLNPGYINILLDTESGRSMLTLALGLQLVGGLLLWRMMRSV